MHQAWTAQEKKQAPTDSSGMIALNVHHFLDGDNKARYHDLISQLNYAILHLFRYKYTSIYVYEDQ